MISVIIASFKEPKTIGRCISSIVNRKYSGIPTSFEIIQVSPDEETLNAGKKEAKKLITDEDFKNQLGEKAYKRVIENFTWQKITHKLIQELNA
jgi:glycosyltransferase involved in cell wall biosynthesis